VVLWTGLLVIVYVALFVGIGFDDGPGLCIGGLVCWMCLVLVVAVPLKELSVGCAFDAVPAETVNDAHLIPPSVIAEKISSVN
jgi:hypothetical protein